MLNQSQLRISELEENLSEKSVQAETLLRQQEQELAAEKTAGFRLKQELDQALQDLEKARATSEELENAASRSACFCYC